MEQINRKTITDHFEKCDKAFETCWSTLVKLKNIKKADNDLAAELISFQVTLAEPLYAIGQLSNKIAAIKREFVGNKGKYKPRWFRKKMKCLADYREGIKHVTNIGKGLGDAFAYFFYRNDLELLEKQFFRERIDSTMPETGAKGELHFLKNIRHLDRQLAIYHGITNILRYGDFSFYDLKKHHIAEIGELKTKKLDGNKCELYLTAISTRTTTEQLPTATQQLPKLDQSMQAKLDRQVDAIVKMLTPEKNQINLNAQGSGTFYIDQLEKLFASARTSQYILSQVSAGLLYVGVRLPKATLYTRIFNRRIEKLLKELPDRTIEEVKKLIKEGSINNSIILGNLLYYDGYVDKNRPGTAPLFWYPLSDSLLKSLYFNYFIVMTIYNPAYFIDGLKDAGFHAITKYNSSEKVEGNFIIEHFDQLISYVTNDLQTEQTLIDATMQLLEVKEKNPNIGKILFRPHLKMSSLFRLNTEEQPTPG